ncbi:Protein Timeless-like [Manis pentadactyla]|nr:Protein Timeless-like [Manis pentadactyla]
MNSRGQGLLLGSLSILMPPCNKQRISASENKQSCLLTGSSSSPVTLIFLAAIPAFRRGFWAPRSTRG